MNHQRDTQTLSVPLVWYDLSGGVVMPVDELPLPPEIPRGSVLVLSGRSAIWRYIRAFHDVAHGSGAVAVGVYDPKLGVVIVASHSPQIREGTVLDIPEGQAFWQQKEIKIQGSDAP